MGEVKCSLAEFVNATPSIIGALAAAGLLIFSVHQFKAARREARSRQTFEYFYKTLSDEKFLDFRDEFNKIIEQNTDPQIRSFSAKLNSREYKALLYMFNHYELTARGIFEGALDRKFYTAHYRRTFLRHWASLNPFVEGLQEVADNKLLGAAAEKLASELRTI